jgi:RNA polymerase sigma-70 factor, ECF subfamily
LLADSVGLALLVVLDTLTPAERFAFVLHDMFAVPFEEIAPMIERSPAAARQLASRARRRVQGAARLPTLISRANAKLSTRSSPPPATETRRARRRAGPQRRATGRRRHGARPPDRRDPRRAGRGRTTLTFTRLAPFVRPALINGTAGVIVAVDVLSDPRRVADLDLAVFDDSP